jgi:hypothetical protein
VKYHSSVALVLTRALERARGPCQAGSLTGAVASQKVTEAPNGPLRVDGNHPGRALAQGGLTATPTSGAGTKVGQSDPTAPRGRAVA